MNLWQWITYHVFGVKYAFHYADNRIKQSQGPLMQFLNSQNETHNEQMAILRESREREVSQARREVETLDLLRRQVEILSLLAKDK